MEEIINIQDMIFEIRGQRVMIDSDLARLYKVPTKALNQAVKRNMRRFPEDFMFRLTDEETQELVTICDRLSRLKHSSSNQLLPNFRPLSSPLPTIRMSETMAEMCRRRNSLSVSRKYSISSKNLQQSPANKCRRLCR